MNMMLGRWMSLILIAVLCVGNIAAREIEVTAAGKSASQDTAKAREIALADALREAVRKGVGTDLTSLSKVTNFTLDYDVVFTQAFGFVRSYEVLEQGFGDDGFYAVKVKALVSDNRAYTTDDQLLKALVRRKRSPRILIKAESKISGISVQPDLSSMLREMALGYQLQVIDPSTVNEAEARRACRDGLVGDKDGANYRRADVALNYDFIIRAKISGSYNGREKVYGTTMETLALAVDLSAIWADTGETIAEVSLPSSNVSSSIGSGSAAARDCVTRLLQGKVPATRKKNAVTVFRRMLTKWVAELDLGRKIQIEVKGVDRPSYDKLLAKLRDTAGIGQAYSREFDSRLFSKIEVESRLTAGQLKDEVLKTLPNHKIDRFTRGYLQFIPGTQASPPVGVAGKVPIDQIGERPHPGQPSSSMPGWAWALIGAGGVLVLLLVFQMGKRSEQ